MASSPINIFSETVAPDKVRAFVEQRFPDAEIEAEGESWTSIVVPFGRRGLFKRAVTLQINHDADHYSSEGWIAQRAGMLNYFDRFEMEGERRERVFRTINSFQFALAFVASPDIGPEEDDERFGLVCMIAKELDACLFLQGLLLDAEGRVLISATGAFDEEAVFPEIMQEPADEITMRDAPVDHEFHPPTPERVARRVLALAAVAFRGVFEGERQSGLAGAGAGAADEESLQRMREWIDALGVRDELEAHESLVIDADSGDLDRQSGIDAMWRMEGLGVLAWALHLYELPPYDELVQIDALMKAVGMFDVGDAQRILADPELRTDEEQSRMGERQLAFHWRLTDFRVRPEAMDFREFGRTCWFGPTDLSWAKFDEDDLALEGAAISKAPGEVVSRCSSAARERHLAINWLRGYSEIYSETDTST